MYLYSPLTVLFILLYQSDIELILLIPKESVSNLFALPTQGLKFNLIFYLFYYFKHYFIYSVKFWVNACLYLALTTY